MRAGYIDTAEGERSWTKSEWASYLDGWQDGTIGLTKPACRLNPHEARCYEFGKLEGAEHLAKFRASKAA